MKKDKDRPVQVIKIKTEPKNGAKFERRAVFSKRYNYEAFDFALCVRCAYFSFDHSKEIVNLAGKYGFGKCRLAKAMGACESVISTAVCDKFLSHAGTDINGKRVTPKRLPGFVKLTKDKKGRCAVTLNK